MRGFRGEFYVIDGVVGKGNGRKYFGPKFNVFVMPDHGMAKTRKCALFPSLFVS